MTMPSLHPFRRLAFAALAPFAAPFAAAAEPAPESYPGLRTERVPLTRPDGSVLQAIVTRPEAGERLPAILFVQWLSCSPVALPEQGGDGWVVMLRRIVRESGALVWRTEKRGVGGSAGDCATLDYETELADHRAALQALRARPDVDPARIVIFGASMGSNQAPLLAQGERVAGVLAWGGGALTWAERTLAFERNALELGGSPPGDLAREMTLRYRFLDRYLNATQDPAAIARAEPAIGAVWPRIVGTDARSHYGRPFAFHQQAQRQDWAGAWARVDAPVLVLYGSHDWFEDARGMELIGRIVNARRPGTAQVVGLPGIDHHFSRYPTREAAFRGKGGQVDAEGAVATMLDWLRQRFATR